MIFFVFLLIFICLILIWHFSTKRFLNPYKLYFYFGKKGCGKSTLLTKLAVRDLVAGKVVYSTEKVRFIKKDKKTGEKILLETKEIIPNRIYNYTFEAGSSIYIDEVNLLWDNRNFKNMDKKIIEWFRLQRHFKVSVHLFSQTFDVDLKIRSLCDEMYIINKFARVFTIARHLVRKPCIVHPGPDSPARIDEDIIEDGLLLAPFGGMIISYIPRWTHLFDSFKHYNSRADLSPIQQEI